VVGDVVGHGVEGLDEGEFERHRLRPGEAHRQQPEAVLGHGDEAQFAIPVEEIGRRKIALAKISRAFQ
jgi:hypothetical protein